MRAIVVVPTYNERENPPHDGDCLPVFPPPAILVVVEGGGMGVTGGGPIGPLN